jgi:hypothetical protein
MFGSSSNQSSAQSSAGLNFNSSGWVVGKGNATGGGVAATDADGLPWYAWASMAVVVGAYFYYKKRKGR